MTLRYAPGSLLLAINFLLALLSAAVAVVLFVVRYGVQMLHNQHILGNKSIARATHKNEIL